MSKAKILFFLVVVLVIGVIIFLANNKAHSTEPEPPPPPDQDTTPPPDQDTEEGIDIENIEQLLKPTKKPFEVTIATKEIQPSKSVVNPVILKAVEKYNEQIKKGQLVKIKFKK